MTTILDSRHMSGNLPRETPDDVEASWREYATLRQVREPDYEIRVRRGTAHAYVNDGRWVADCPGARCNGGMAAWPEHDRVCCLDCGSIWQAVYPAPEEIRAAEDALKLRPREHRNWRPDRGETAETLRHENIEHGYLPSGEQAERHRLERELAERTGATVEQVRAILAGGSLMSSEGRVISEERFA